MTANTNEKTPPPAKESGVLVSNAQERIHMHDKEKVTAGNPLTPTSAEQARRQADIVTATSHEPTEAPTCRVCGLGFEPDGPVVEVGQPVGGRIHVTSQCLRGASDRFAQALAELRAGETKSKASRGLVVSVLGLGGLAGLVAAVTFGHLVGWPLAAVVFAIGVLAGLAVRWHAARKEGQ